MRRKVAVVALLMLAAVLAGRQAALSPPGILRFHVIANSDAAEDQRAKERVRDAVLALLGPELAEARSAAEARALVESRKDAVAAAARAVLASSGLGYPVRVEIGSFPFPARPYRDFVLPAGNYEAVRLVLGKGEGRNWWCVLFPPFCLAEAPEAHKTLASGGKREAVRLRLRGILKRELSGPVRPRG